MDYAAEKNQSAMVRVLLKHGANIDLCRPENKEMIQSVEQRWLHEILMHPGANGGAAVPLSNHEERVRSSMLRFICLGSLSKFLNGYPIPESDPNSKRVSYVVADAIEMEETAGAAIVPWGRALFEIQSNIPEEYGSKEILIENSERHNKLRAHLAKRDLLWKKILGFRVFLKDLMIAESQFLENKSKVLRKTIEAIEGLKSISSKTSSDFSNGYIDLKSVRLFNREVEQGIREKIRALKLSQGGDYPFGLVGALRILLGTKVIDNEDLSIEIAPCMRPNWTETVIKNLRIDLNNCKMEREDVRFELSKRVQLVKAIEVVLLKSVEFHPLMVECISLLVAIEAAQGKLSEKRHALDIMHLRKYDVPTIVEVTAAEYELESARDAVAKLRGSMDTLQKKLVALLEEIPRVPLFADNPPFPEVSLAFEVRWAITLADYKIIKSNREEGKGNIIFAISPTGVSCALKRYHYADDDSRQRFSRELRILQEVNHRSIISITNYFFDGKFCYIEMPRYKQNLGEWAKGHAPLQRLLCAPWIFYQVLQGLNELHRLNIIHRNIKLENILMDESGAPVIADFDVSKDLRNPTWTFSIDEAGTGQHIAPEVREGKSRGTTASDMYSLGVLMFKLYYPHIPLLDGYSLRFPPSFPDPLLVSLAKILTHRNPKRRPNAVAAMREPYFRERLSVRKNLDSGFGSNIKISYIDLEIQKARSTAKDYLLELDSEGKRPVTITVRRSDLVADVVTQVNRIDAKSSPLLFVKFIGEEVIDNGGASRELFTEFFQSVCDPEHGWFVQDDQSGFILPMKNKEAPIYRTFGSMLARCLFNHAPVHLPLPIAFWKYLKGCKTEMSDLEEVDPVVFGNLMLLFRTAEGLAPDEAIDGLTMISADGSPLKQNGDQIVVTSLNLYRYVSLYAEDYLVKSRKAALKAIKDGFYSVLGVLEIVKPIPWAALPVLLCGPSSITFNQLRDVLRYEGFPGASKTPEFLEKFLFESDSDTRKLFLMFTTGSATIPYGSSRRLRKMVGITVRCVAGDLARFPEASTCVGIVALPDYNNFDLLCEKFSVALKFSSGFGHK